MEMGMLIDGVEKKVVESTGIMIDVGVTEVLNC